MLINKTCGLDRYWSVSQLYKAINGGLNSLTRSFARYDFLSIFGIINQVREHVRLVLVGGSPWLSAWACRQKLLNALSIKSLEPCPSKIDPGLVDVSTVQGSIPDIVRVFWHFTLGPDCLDILLALVRYFLDSSYVHIRLVASLIHHKHGVSAHPELSVALGSS